MRFKEKIAIFRNRLTRFGEEEPLSKLSLTVVILLDIFLLFVLFSGLDSHTDQLTSPYEYFPYHYRSIFIENQWTEADRLNKLQNIVLSDYNNYMRDSYFDENKAVVMHPICNKYQTKIKHIAQDSELQNLFRKRQTLQRQKASWKSKQRENKSVYDTSLMESNSQKSLPSVSKEINQASSEFEKITAQLAEIDSTINDNQLVQDLWQTMGTKDPEHRDKLIQSLKRYDFFYELRSFLWQLLYLLPIFAIAIFWNVRSVNKSKNTQILFSSHLLVIASIPIIFKVLDLVLELIPNRFFKALFDWLKLIHLVALWHYFLILLGISVAILAVYIIQKVFFSREKIHQKRLIKGNCCYCGKKLPINAKKCPFCGKNRMRECENCHADTYVGGKFCINCGK